MIKEVNFKDFKRAFKDHERENQFKHTLGKLFFEIQSIEDETGEQYELDVIELSCEWSEQSIEDVANEEGVTVREVFTAIEDQGNEHMLVEIDGVDYACLLDSDWNDIYEGLRELKEEENQARNEEIGETVETYSDDLVSLAREIMRRNDKIDIQDVLDDIEQVFDDLLEELKENH